MVIFMAIESKVSPSGEVSFHLGSMMPGAEEPEGNSGEKHPTSGFGRRTQRVSEHPSQLDAHKLATLCTARP